MAKNDNTIMLLVAAGLLLGLYLMMQSVVNGVQKTIGDTEKDLLSKLPSVNLPSISLNLGGFNLGGISTGLKDAAGTTMHDAQTVANTVVDGTKKTVDTVNNTVDNTGAKGSGLLGLFGNNGSQFLSNLLGQSSPTPYSGPVTTTIPNGLAAPTTTQADIQKAQQMAQFSLTPVSTAVLPANKAGAQNTSVQVGSSTSPTSSISMGGTGVWDPNTNTYKADNGVSSAPNLLPTPATVNKVLSADAYIASNPNMSNSQLAAVIQASAPQTIVGSGSTMHTAPNPSAGSVQLVYHTETRMITRDNGKGVMVPQPTQVQVDQFGNTK